MNLLNLIINNNENKFLSLADVEMIVLNKLDANEVSIFNFKKHVFAGKVFTLMLVQRKQSMYIQKCFQMLHYLFPTKPIDVIASDFNCDLLTVLELNYYIFSQTISKW